MHLEAIQPRFMISTKSAQLVYSFVPYLPTKWYSLSEAIWTKQVNESLDPNFFFFLRKEIVKIFFMIHHRMKMIHWLCYWWGHLMCSLNHVIHQVAGFKLTCHHKGNMNCFPIFTPISPRTQKIMIPNYNAVCYS